MKYLLDTHVLLWWLDNKSPLKPAARQIIDDGENVIIVSVVSIWEIAIKMALHQLQAPDNLLDILIKNNIQTLAITAPHAAAVRDLPLYHTDPFDRLLITQAQIEGLTIMTDDKALGRYTVACLMV